MVEDLLARVAARPLGFPALIAPGAAIDGAKLVEAVEQTGCSYMMAENFGYLRDCMEIARMYRSGDLGELVYGEAEYVHSVRHLMVRNADGSYHWRCWMPPFYYGHALAVLLQITGTRPVSRPAAGIGTR